MGRAPCCEKMGLKRGPWTPEEDLILINYINTYGHANWRALPKLAGLLRCGKSCRLRWINYLRPDIKRGNFTKEEEDTIISLHETLGNRWSAIASRLPGRTDNEIKNVWHTHLKKRLPQKEQQNQNDTKRSKKQAKLDDVVSASKSKQEENIEEMPLSPPQCSSDVSFLTTTSDNNSSSIINNNNDDMLLNVNDDINTPENNLAILDEDFWSQVLSPGPDDSCETSCFPDIALDDFDPFQPIGNEEGMDFWCNVYARAEELTELLEL